MSSQPPAPSPTTKPKKKPPRTLLRHSSSTRTSLLTSFRQKFNSSLNYPTTTTTPQNPAFHNSFSSSKSSSSKSLHLNYHHTIQSLPPSHTDLDRLFGSIDDTSPPSWSHVRNILTDDSTTAALSPERRRRVVTRGLRDGRTILHWALRHGAPMDVIQTIVQVGSSSSPSSSSTTTENVVRSADTHGCIPLHEACFLGNLPLITLLLDVGGNDTIRTVSKWGTTPLHSACLGRACSREVMEVLIERGGRGALRQRNNVGNSALHMSCEGDTSVEVIRMIVDCAGRECLGWRNVKGETPLDYACRHDTSVEVFDLLVERGGEGEEDGGGGGEGMERIAPSTITAILEWVQMKKERAAGGGLFQSPFLQRILNDMFIHPRYLTVLMIDFYVQLVLVLVFSFGINGAVEEERAISTLVTVGLVLAVVWNAARELLQMVTTPLKVYMHDGTEVLDWAQIGFAIWSLQILLMDYPPQSIVSPSTQSHRALVLTITTGLTWLELIYILGDLFSEIAIFTQALRRIIVKCIPFLVTTVLIVLGFAHMFYITSVAGGNCSNLGDGDDDNLNNDDNEITEDNWTCNLSASYFVSISILLEGAHHYLIESPTRITQLESVHVLSIVFALLIGIFLLNILIAQISDVFSEVSEKGTDQFWSNRYASMFELHRIYGSLPRGGWWSVGAGDGGGGGGGGGKGKPVVVIVPPTVDTNDDGDGGDDGGDEVVVVGKEEEEGGNDKEKITERTLEENLEEDSDYVSAADTNNKDDNNDDDSDDGDDNFDDDPSIALTVLTGNHNDSDNDHSNDDHSSNNDDDDDNDNENDNNHHTNQPIPPPTPPPPPPTSPLPPRFDFSSTLVKDTYFKYYQQYPESERLFVEWWTGISPTPPPLPSRIRYYAERSFIGELVLPGKVLEKILRGSGEERGFVHYCARIMTYLVFVLVPVTLFGTFLVGLLTLGLAWPRWMREFLFFGGIGTDSTVKEDLVEVRASVRSVMEEVGDLKGALVESRKMLMMVVEEQRVMMREVQRQQREGRKGVEE